MDGTNNPLNLMCVCKECHHLIHGNIVLNNELVKKKLEEHPEVRQHGTKELLERVKNNRQRKLLHKWEVPGMKFVVMQ